MISQETQKKWSDHYNIERNNNNIVFLEGYYREADFEDSHPGFAKLGYRQYRDMTDGLIWRVIKAENCCGLRVKRAIVDTRISEEFFNTVILPMCANNCIRLEFFD